MGATEQFDTGDMTFNIDEDDCDMVSDDDIASADSSVDKPVGRPRLEDKRRFGRAVVDFVESFISARGQHTVDGQRMKPITGVFGAPLQAIAVAVQEHFGQTVSRNGIWNLLAPPRRNSIGAARGLVNARPVKIVATEKKPHPRSRFSASLFKYDKQLLALASSQGVRCIQVHGDDMAKVPMYIPCRPGSSPKGFVMTRKDGKPAFTELGHSFPVAERMLMATSGCFFVQCQPKRNNWIGQSQRCRWQHQHLCTRLCAQPGTHPFLAGHT